jgi:hypothetical protein
MEVRVSQPATWINTRTAKTSNYTAQNTDNGSTFGLGGNSFFTLNFPSPASFSASFTVGITNEDSGRAKFISLSSGAASFYLWPLQSVLVYNDNGAWQVVGDGRWKLPPGVTTTINTDPVNGSDTFGAADGLGTGSGALKSIANALLFVLSNFDFSQGLSGAYQSDVTILNASGATDNQYIHFSAKGVLGGQGSPGLTIDLNGGVLDGTSNNSIQINGDGAYLTIQNGTIQNSYGFSALGATNLGQIFLGTSLTFGPVSGTGHQIFAVAGGNIQFNATSGTYIFNGANTTGSLLYLDGGTTQGAIGTISFSSNATYGSVVRAGGNSYCAATDNLTWATNGHTITARPYDLEPTSTILDAGLIPGTGISSRFGAQFSPNLLLNPDFSIDQPNEGSAYAVTNTASLPIMDGWAVDAVVASASSLTVQRVANNHPTPYPYSCVLTVGTGGATGSNDLIDLYAVVSHSDFNALAWGCAVPAIGAVVSFIAQSSVAGTYFLVMENWNGSRAYYTPYTLAANTATYVEIAIPADASNTAWTDNDNNSSNVGAYLRFVVGAGSNRQGSSPSTWGSLKYATSSQTQLQNTTGATFALSNVKLEAGQIATQFESVNRADQLARAQYRYRKTFPAGTGVGQNAGVAGALTVRSQGNPSIYWHWGGSMIATPTITTYNPSNTNANWRDVTAGSDVTVNTTRNAVTNSTGVLIDANASATTNDFCCIHVVADARLT